MRTIQYNQPPIQLQAQIESGGLKEITQTNQAGETTAVSTAKGIALNEAQQLALTNGRLFEAGVSMAVLDRPGTVGKVFDTYARRLADVLTPVLTGGDAAERPVHFNGSEKPLVDVFKDTMLTPMTDPKSDQIGRKTTEEGNGAAWIVSQLHTPLMSPSGEYAAGQDFKNLLTKVKAVCGFGTTVWQLMNQPDAAKRTQNEAVLREVMKPLGEGVASQFGARFDEFKEVMRTPLFDDSISRMRSERQPLDTQGKPIPVEYESADLHGLGFGNVAVTATDDKRQAELDQLLGAKTNAAGTKVYANSNGAAREGAPIEPGASGLPERPFMMASNELRLALDSPLMNSYQNLLFSTQGGAEQTFHEALDNHAFPHGTGVNRWQPTGTFAVESNLRGLPSAGAQSGGTCDALLALNTLSDGPLYDRFDIVEPATLGIAAFMNFGGYHTFAETVPVGMAMANGADEFNPSSGTTFRSAERLAENVPRQPALQQAIETPGNPLTLDTLRADFFGPVGTDLLHENLYQRVAGMAANYTNASGDILAIHDAYEQNHGALCDAHPELRQLGTVGIQISRVDPDRLA
ncbi:hypothetical protein [Burkholderia ubonensis]|uniref:hypothetical protein n=1 Tax=Burkholderia ubonensis TaxID=101571 RepID=UPI00075EB90D|nr:hypothetical protein [Burkholderia ubonensis]KVW47289.1 hypothetical protein WK95_06185 [Burkholderia ubonensis]